MESTTSAAHILQQSDELENLTKELDKCKADKEFVWGLWKKLQKNNPDLNAAIEMVVQREKITHQQRLDQLLAYGQEKESEFDKLSEETQQLNKRLEEEREKRNTVQSVNQQLTSELAAARDDLYTANRSIAGYEETEKKYTCLKERNSTVETEFEVIKQQFSTQEHIYKSQINEMSDKMRILALENGSLSSRVVAGETRRRDMQEELNGFGKQLKQVSEECSQRVDATRELDELLSCNREKLEEREVELERVKRENEDMMSQLSECVVEGERHKLCNHETRSLVKHLGDNLKEKEEELKNTHSLNELLSNKVMELERENTHLKVHMKELESFKLNITQIQYCDAGIQTTHDLLSLGSNMSLEVVVQLLESKTLEFNQLKISHDRRLARYKELQTAHKLLRDQLSTYAPDSMLPVQKQNDVEERVLNERVPMESTLAITYETHAEVQENYKLSQEENARLTETITSLEESVDQLKCDKLHLESVVSELMYSVEQDRASIIARLASLHAISSDTDVSSNDNEGSVLERKFSLELRIGELEECLLDLERGRKEWANEHQKLVNEYDQLAARLKECELEIDRKDKIICEREKDINMLRERTYTTHVCQTESLDHSTRSVSSQTIQQLVKQYPPLRHVTTQTTLITTAHTPVKLKTSCEVRSLHKRIASLNRQVEVLTDTRSHLKSCLEDEQERVTVLETQLSENVYKLKVSQAEYNSLTSEALILKQANTTLQETIQSGLVDRESETSAIFSRLEARLKSSSDECSRQASTLYRLNRDLQEKKGQLDSMTESGLRKDKEYKQNLAQKRHLLEDTREQTQKMKSTIQSNEDLIRKQTSEIRRLTDLNSNINNRIGIVKEQLARVSEERDGCTLELEEANIALLSHTQQLNQSQTECSRKIQLLRAAKTQIDHLSDLFGEEDNTNLEEQLVYVTTCVDEYKRTIICLSELVWCKKYNKTGSGHERDILSLSAQEMLEVAKQGVTTVTPVWKESNLYVQIVSLLEKPPPFALRLVELIISILDL